MLKRHREVINALPVAHRQAVLEFLDSNPRTRVFLAGTVTDEISDLDLVVLDKKPIVPALTHELLRGGNVLVCPSKFIHLLEDIESLSLRVLQGDDALFAERANERAFRAIEILEWLPERICALQGLQGCDDKVRIALVVKSAYRSIFNVAAYTGDADAAARAQEMMMLTRAVLLGSVTPSDLNRLRVQAYEDCLDAWERFSVTQSIFAGSLAHGRVSISRNYDFVADEYPELVVYYRAMIESRPDALLSQRLGERITVQRCHATILDNEFHEYACWRWQLLCSIFDWFVSRGFKQGMIKYGWLT